MLLQSVSAIHFGQFHPVRKKGGVSQKPSQESVQALKEAIIREARYMAQQGLTAGSGGNISVRQGDRVLITTAGSRFSSLTLDDICIVDLNGRVLQAQQGKKPSSELPLHLETYKRRGDVGSVIHCHPVYISTYAVTNRTPLKSILPHTSKHFNDLKVAKYNDAGSYAVARHTVDVLGDSEAVIMGNHGALVTGKDLAVAVKTADSLENYAKISYLLENTNKEAVTICHLTPKQVRHMRANLRPGIIKEKDPQLDIFLSIPKTYTPFLQNQNTGKNALVAKFLKDPESVITEKIAVSTNSTIYKISDNANQVAIKMQHFAPNRERGIVKRQAADLNGEFEVLKKLPHNIKNTSNVLGAITNKKGDVIGIVMDYIKGKTINIPESRLSVPLLQTLYNDLFKLDKAGIFHGDLQLANLIKTDNGLCIIDYVASKELGDLKNLGNRNAAYLMPDFVYPSNLECFEYTGLLTYLRQMSNEYENGTKNADSIFLKHLCMKADYHARRYSMLSQMDVSDEVKENEKTLADVFSLLNRTSNSNVVSAVKRTELLKIKAYNAAKMARMFFENDVKNYATGIYWNYQEGFQIKALMAEALKNIEKFSGDATLRKYFMLQYRLAEFHYNNIYLASIQKNTEKISEALDKNDVPNINSVIQEGNLLPIRDAQANWIGACAGLYSNSRITKGKYM